MQECDLFQAVEQAAFRYLAGYLINRVGKLLIKRFVAGLVILVGGTLADKSQPVGDIIGLVILTIIAIWSIYSVSEIIRDDVDRFRNRIWQ